jgi:hypothetical protein
VKCAKSDPLANAVGGDGVWVNVISHDHQLVPPVENKRCRFLTSETELTRNRAEQEKQSYLRHDGRQIQEKATEANQGKTFDGRPIQEKTM